MRLREKYINLCCNCSHAESCGILVNHNNLKKVCERFKHRAKIIHTVVMTEKTQDSVMTKNLCVYCKNINICEKKNDESNIQDCGDFLLLDY